MKNLDVSYIAFSNGFRHINVIKFLINSSHNLKEVYLEPNFYKKPDFHPELNFYLRDELLEFLNSENITVKSPTKDGESYYDILVDSLINTLENVDCVFTHVVWAAEKEKLFPPDNFSDKYGIDKNRVLFIRNGFIPWSRTFHFTYNFSGRSLLAEKEIEFFENNEVCYEKIEYALKYLKNGKKDFSAYKPFCYVPLQKPSETKVNLYSLYGDLNVNRNSHNRDMFDFVELLDNIIPKKYNLLLKPHPDFDNNDKNYTDISERVSVLNDKYSVYSCIDQSDFVCSINSTSVIESIAMNKKVFSYGDDVFCNKNLTYHKVYDEKTFKELVDEPIKNLHNTKNLRFISHLMERSFDKNILENARGPKLLDYVSDHYWNEKLLDSEWL